MVKNNLLLQVAVLALAAACSNPYLPENDMDDECTSVMMVMPSAEFDDSIATKAEVNIGSSIEFVWSESDVVGIFPQTGSQLYFSMAEGAGKSSALFDGGGWAMKKTASYYSYFPFYPDFYFDRTAIPMTFEGQEQDGNGDPDHADMGTYNYMVATGEYDATSKTMAFNYKRLATLFRFMIPVAAGTYTSLTVSADSKCIASSGTFNSIEIDYAINDPVYTDKLTLELNDLVLESEGTLVGWMVLPPFNLLDKQLTISITDKNGAVTTSSVAGKNYQRTYLYNNVPNFSIYPQTATISGKGGSATLKITTSKSTTYSVSTDADWLTLGSTPTTGAATITVTASENPGTRREGHVVVTETVTTSSGTTIDLKNVMTIIQTVNGMNVDMEDWGDGDKIEGEV